MIAKVFLVCLVLCAVASDAAVIQFSGRDLPYMDIGNGFADAYAHVYYAPTSTAPYELLQTTDDIGSTDPDWPERFDIPYVFGSTQKFKVEVYDADSPDSDDYMGYIEFQYSEIINDSDGLLTKNLIGGEPGGGYILIKRLSS